MKLVKYLGALLSDLLTRPPFANVPTTRSQENELPEPEIHYEFGDLGLDVTCDADERIRTIFVHRSYHGELSPVPMNARRAEVLALLGVPTKRGDALHDPILGDQGPWDRFDTSTYSIHVQYQVHADKIDLVTLMRADVVPPS